MDQARRPRGRPPKRIQYRVSGLEDLTEHELHTALSEVIDGMSRKRYIEYWREVIRKAIPPPRTHRETK